MILESDIVVLEHSYRLSSDWLEEMMNGVSNGLYEPGMIMQLFGLDPGYLPLLTTLHRSHKKIMLERSPLTEEQASAMKKLIISKQASSLEDAINEYGGKLRQIADYHRQRDESLSLLLDEICSKNPGLEILVPRGGMHQRVLEKSLRDRGLEFSSQCASDEFLMRSEILSKMSVGEEPTCRELMIAMLEEIRVRKLGMDVQNLPISTLSQIHRELEKMSEDELKASLHDPV